MGGGGRGVDFSVTVLIGISMIGSKSVRGGGGACVMAFGREMRWQCLTWGPLDLEEEDIIII